MKTSFLYGVIIALVIIVGALGYSKYANNTAPVTAPETVAISTDETPAEAAPTETVQAEAPAATEVAADATVATTPEEATAAAQETPAPIADAVSADEQSLLAAPAALNMSVADMMADRVLGDGAAPITIIEFASFTCSHCATFHTTVLPTVKEQLIATGKAKLILREFPLDKFALKASLLARCAPADKYYDLVDVIFRNQDRWVKSEDPVASLKQLAALTGMDDAQMESCLNNTEMETALLKRVTDAQASYKVQSTPTFVFNEGAESFAGAQTPERFQQVVDQLSK